MEGNGVEVREWDEIAISTLTELKATVPRTNYFRPV